jgi:hypothetical protein
MISTDHIALAASLLAILGQVANAYLKLSILKEIGERETALRKDMDATYVRKDVCRQIGGCS